MKIVIHAGRPAQALTEKFDYYVGIDRGALFLLEEQHHLDLAVGDFDSVNAKEFARISEDAAELFKLPEEKDQTDLEAGLELVRSRFPEAEVTIIGSLGGRLDHHLTNVYLPLNFANYENICLKDAQNLVRYLSAGEHTIKKIEGYPYLGLVQVNTGRSLEIKNAKYPLKATDNFADIYASNAFISDSMDLQIDQGQLIVIYSKDS
ncbi:thiamine diphosphokinase [Lactococcus garvieae]|uniref:thiamine diphosphokinase n=1 Tax=Lactococcus garvieae TaxID=1363 RepID=UPI0018D98A5A|nr:thiamine diphosphokinase [Lactococcus garvieae]QPS70304.1 thiamine diphosphokinase [Lactococcus garvieae]